MHAHAAFRGGGYQIAIVVVNLFFHVLHHKLSFVLQVRINGELDIAAGDETGLADDRIVADTAFDFTSAAAQKRFAKPFNALPADPIIGAVFSQFVQPRLFGFVKVLGADPADGPQQMARDCRQRIRTMRTGAAPGQENVRDAYPARCSYLHQAQAG